MGNVLSGHWETIKAYIWVPDLVLPRFVIALTVFGVVAAVATVMVLLLWRTKRVLPTPSDLQFNAGATTAAADIRQRLGYQDLEKARQDLQHARQVLKSFPAQAEAAAEAARKGYAERVTQLATEFEEKRRKINNLTNSEYSLRQNFKRLLDGDPDAADSLDDDFERAFGQHEYDSWTKMQTEVKNLIQARTEEEQRLLAIEQDAERRIAEIQQEVQRTESDISRLETSIDGDLQELEAFAQKLEAMRNESVTLSPSQAQDLAQAIKQDVTDTKALMAAVMQLEGEESRTLNDYSQTIQRLEAESKVWRAAAESHDATNRANERQIALLKELQQSDARMAAQVNEFRHEIDRLASENDALKAEFKLERPDAAKTQRPDLNPTAGHGKLHTRCSSDTDCGPQMVCFAYTDSVSACKMIAMQSLAAGQKCSSNGLCSSNICRTRCCKPGVTAAACDEQGNGTSVNPSSAATGPAVEDNSTAMAQATQFCAARTTARSLASFTKADQAAVACAVDDSVYTDMLQIMQSGDDTAMRKTAQLNVLGMLRTDALNVNTLDASEFSCPDGTKVSHALFKYRTLTQLSDVAAVSQQSSFTCSAQSNENTDGFRCVATPTPSVPTVSLAPLFNDLGTSLDTMRCSNGISAKVFTNAKDNNIFVAHTADFQRCETPAVTHLNDNNAYQNVFSSLGEAVKKCNEENDCQGVFECTSGALKTVGTKMQVSPPAQNGFCMCNKFSDAKFALTDDTKYDLNITAEPNVMPELSTFYDWAEGFQKWDAATQNKFFAYSICDKTNCNSNHNTTPKNLTYLFNNTSKTQKSVAELFKSLKDDDDEEKSQLFAVFNVNQKDDKGSLVDAPKYEPPGIAPALLYQSNLTEELLDGFVNNAVQNKCPGKPGGKAPCSNLTLARPVKPGGLSFEQIKDLVRDRVKRSPLRIWMKQTDASAPVARKAVSALDERTMPNGYMHTNASYDAVNDKINPFVPAVIVGWSASSAGTYSVLVQ